MRTIIAQSLCLLILTAVTSPAAVVQYWNFDSYAGGTSVTATTGGGTLTASGNALSSQTGTSVNEINPVDNSPAQALQIGGNKHAAPPIVTIQFSRTASQVDFILTYASLYTGYYSSQTWQWSTDGSTWSSVGIVGAAVTGSTSWTTHTVDFSGVSALEQSGVTTVWFRDTTSYAGSPNSSSTINFDTSKSAPFRNQPRGRRWVLDSSLAAQA